MPPLDPIAVTLASLLTAAGALIASIIVTTFVDVLKRPFPNLDGMIATFVASFVLYVLVFIDANVWTIAGGFVCFLAWLACATAALGVHKAVLGPTSVSDKISGG